MRNKRNQKIVLAGTLLGLGLCLSGVGKAESVLNKENLIPTPVVTVEGVTEYRLPNGLKVVLYPDASKPTATVNMTYLVGSRQENYGETGMAHLLEHLMFKGSKNYPHPTAEFTRRGFRMNGSTWLDRTNYFVSFTANDDNLKWALGWSADAMTNSFIARKDLDTEMTVVRNEYEMGENRPVSVMMKRMQSVMFDWHSYGRSTIGARSDIENVEIENLQAFYHRYYQPDNAVLTISGKIDPQKTLAMVGELFGPIPKPTRVLPKEWTVEPTADGEREFTIRRKGETQLVAVGYRVPAALNPDYEPAAIGVDILADNPSGRLYKSLVDTGLATEVFGWTIPGRDPGFVMFGAMVKKGDDINIVKKKLIEGIENAFKEKGVTDEELARQKVDQATMFSRILSDPEQFGVEISDYIGLGDWRLFFADRDHVERMTKEDIDKVWGKYFVRDNRVVGLFLPEDHPKRAVITPAPSAEEFLKQFTFKSEGSQAEAFDVSPANIDKRTQIVDFGHVRVALLPKKTNGETVVVRMKFNNGNNETSRNGALDLVTGSMLSRGTKSMTRDQIEDAFTQLKMDGSPFGFVTDRDNVVGAIELVGQLFADSTIPQKELQTLIRQTSAGLKAKSDDPTVMARDALTTHFNTYPKGDARHQDTSADMIAALEKLTQKEVQEQYRKVFGTARGMIAVVGDFDVDAVKAALQKSVIGVKKSDVTFDRVITEFKPVEAKRIVINTPQKENATLLARLDFPANVADKDAPALIVADWIIGGSDGLANRLVNRLRQKEGLSYGVGSSLRLPDWGNRGVWSLFAIVAPQNLKQAETSMKDELTKVFKNGITESELQEAKRGLIESRAINRAQDVTLAGGWLGFLDTGRTWAFSEKMEDGIKRLSVADVNAAVARLADPAKLTFVLAGDEEKAKAAGKDFQ